MAASRHGRFARRNVLLLDERGHNRDRRCLCARAEASCSARHVRGLALVTNRPCLRPDVVKAVEKVFSDLNQL
ncbi:MAG: hypothetical protein J2P50_16225 [Hyphomicrobiaceae bacterium]|nr:hypothetical protein [Hyphomicrobiaceae bacterium]